MVNEPLLDGRRGHFCSRALATAVHHKSCSILLTGRLARFLVRDAPQLDVHDDIEGAMGGFELG